ncbi:MAG: FadR family transcriptional regulator [Candidatus Atribacteria bacterium]|nr:FadR family transcriptional regulator [Candidatus Atribacteria bacterium]
MELKNLKTQNLQGLIQKQLELYIIENGMKTGDPFPTEHNLAERLGISRTAIREALKRLETLGIIEVRPGVGRFIREFNFEAILKSLPYNLEMDIKNFQEVLEVRFCLESWFIAKDINKFTKENISQSKEVLKKLEFKVLNNFQEKDLVETHSQFHCALYENSDNSLLIHLIKIFSTIQRNLTLLHRYETKDRNLFIRQHKLLLEAIEKKDSRLAQKRLEEHFAEAIAWAESHKGEKFIKIENNKGGEEYSII